MSLFNKEKKVRSEGNPSELPELPALPEPKQLALLPKSKIPDVPSGLPKIETNTLPILPNSEAGEKFNQEAIKEAINKPKIPIINPEPKFQEDLPNPQEYMPKFQEPIPTQNIEEKMTLEIPDITPSKIQRPTRKMDPVFIRLDKFQATNETFEEIKNKVEEIDELLKKTREIKVREEEELAEWEREIQIIKSRIDLIDRNIFEKLGDF